MNLLLFITCSLIWGSTWMAIKLQLGAVEPMVSIFYRFLIAISVLLVYCVTTRRRLRFLVRDHLVFLITGGFMFCFNYWLVYTAETLLTSGVVAIMFSTMIFLNAVNNRIFLRVPVDPKVILGGLIGLGGLGLIFYREITSLSLGDKSLAALGLGLLGALSASLGNTAAQVAHKRRIPTVQMSLFAMGYGTLLMGAMAVITGARFTIDASPAYLGSLAYLGVVGSVVAFLAYLTLLKNIGSDRTAYITLVTPLVALAISTGLEGYTWSAAALAGVALILAGNYVALRPRTRRA